jgi:hypothetical protein
MTLYPFRIFWCPNPLQQRTVLAVTAATAATWCCIVQMGKRSIIISSLVKHYNVTATTLNKMVEAKTSSYFLLATHNVSMQLIYWLAEA